MTFEYAGEGAKLLQASGEDMKTKQKELSMFAVLFNVESWWARQQDEIYPVIN